MAGRQYHSRDLTITPYSMGNESDDDDTYLKMNQFKERGSSPSPMNKNVFSQLDNVLMRRNNEHGGSVPGFHQPPERNSVIGTERFGARPAIPSPAPRDPQTNQNRRHSAAPFPNYTRWDPAKKAAASRFPPPVSRPPPPVPPMQRQDISGPAVDDCDQDDYLTFEQPQLPERSYPPEPSSRPPFTPHFSAPPHPGPPVHPRRSLIADDPGPGPAPARPPRSPKYPTSEPNEFPDRPPPPPPGFPLPRHDSPTSGPGYPLPRRDSPTHGYPDSGRSDSSYSPSSSRNTSFKDEHISHIPTRRDNLSTDSSYSSAHSSRAASLNKKDERPIISHLPNRKDNFSTGSSGSASSDELTQPLHASRNGTPNKFVPLRNSKPSPSKFPVLPRQLPPSRDVPRAMPAMPEFTSHSASPSHEEKPDRALETEEQPWFIDGDRTAAQRRIEEFKQTGTFMVRPRESDDQPYALTLWANNKFYNFVIRKKSNGKYALGSKKENERSYATVAMLIEHHQSSELKLADDEGAVILTSPP